MNLQSALSGMVLLLGVAFALNIPLGYLRQGSQRYSFRWFLYIHLSIPVIIGMRLWLGYGWELIPFTLGCAVLGQVVGGRLHRRRCG